MDQPLLSASVAVTPLVSGGTVIPNAASLVLYKTPGKLSFTMLSHNPYLHFNGTCRQAMTFYAKVFQTIVNFNTTYEKMPPGTHQGPIDPHRILHCELHSGPFILMASDGPLDFDATPGRNFAISLSCSSEAELERLFNELSENGNGHLPPHTAFWGGRFAMLIDQFQISWMLSYRA